MVLCVYGRLLMNVFIWSIWNECATFTDLHLLLERWVWEARQKFPFWENSLLMRFWERNFQQSCWFFVTFFTITKSWAKTRRTPFMPPQNLSSHAGKKPVAKQRWDQKWHKKMVHYASGLWCSCMNFFKSYFVYSYIVSSPCQRCFKCVWPMTNLAPIFP